MNLIYPAHAKNQVRFEEKREKNVSAPPGGNDSGGPSVPNEVGAGGVGTSVATELGGVALPREMRSGQGERATVMR